VAHIKQEARMSVTGQRTILAMALLSAACGDDKSSRPVYASGVDAGVDASVSTLSDSQREQICSSREVYLNTSVNLDVVVRAACLATAIFIGGTPDDCQSAFDKCVANRGGDIGVNVNVTSPFLGSACANDLRECDASVQALETCVNVNTGFAYEFLEAISCRGAGQAASMEQARKLGAQGCATLGSSCAGFDEPVLR
jgi:hypothetical protein